MNFTFKRGSNNEVIFTVSRARDSQKYAVNDHEWVLTVAE
jgi:hypothetical protein